MADLTVLYMQSSRWFYGYLTLAGTAPQLDTASHRSA
jgi:hypothetical protein